MSGLEKFEANEEWRQRLRNYILMKRETPAAPATKVTEQSQRYSLDFDPEFKAILNEKKQQKMASEAGSNSSATAAAASKYMPYYVGGVNNKENYELPGAAANAAAKRRFFATNDDSLLDQRHYADDNTQATSDASFEVLEKMCDKTASDPDSTLFHYLAEQKRSMSIGCNVSSPTACKATERDAADIDRALEELMSGVEITQLEDVEAPSRLWENTITDGGSNMLQTSPVKMVGLMRPSTILEDFAEDATLNSSYATANCKNGQTIELSTSSSYETANDATNNREATDSVNVSMDLIDLEQTFAPLRKSPHSSVLDMTVNEWQQESDEQQKPQNVEANDSNESNGSSSIIEVHSGDETTLQRNSPIDKAISIADTYAESDVGAAATFDTFADTVDADDGDDDFNDSIERFNYMMRKGMELAEAKAASNLAAKAAAQQSLETAAANAFTAQRQDTFTISPQKSMLSVEYNTIQNRPLTALRTEKPLHNSPTSSSSSTATRATPQATHASPAKSKTSSRYAIEFKPRPKIDFFKKPAALPSGIPIRRPLDKERQFQHIVSPIGTYIKKTTTAPQMGSIATRNCLDVTAFRELEEEALLCRLPIASGGDAVEMPIAANNAALPDIRGAMAQGRLLPKKAYIAAKTKQLMDERTPHVIPGGESVQQFLAPALLPTVLRHEGQRKLPTRNGGGGAALELDRTSLSNVPVTSGDVSVYTMKDAHKL